MSTKGILKRVIVILMMSSYLFDAYHKLTYTPIEADKLRARYQSFYSYSKNKLGIELPLSSDTLSVNRELITQSMAAIELVLCVLIWLGIRSSVFFLVVFTFLHDWVMTNPWSANATAIDKSKGFEVMFINLSLSAALMIVYSSSSGKSIWK